jgi:hypothetical protein
MTPELPLAVMMNWRGLSFQRLKPSPSLHCLARSA